MIPLKDDIPSRTRPVVNIALIAITTLVFLLQLAEPEGAASLIERWGMIPARVVDPDREVLVVELEQVATAQGPMVRRVTRPAAPPAVPPWLTVLTCVFLHGGIMHFLGNMWFLWIFGDNVEDRFGHFGYVLFYVGCGVAASLAHLWAGPGSTVPTIGASGAIAGVMGAYFLLYPKARVLALVPLGFILQMLVLPAPLFLGLWFVIQLFQGSLTVGDVESGGVAWWAHIGGFVVGFALAAVLRTTHHLRPAAAGKRTFGDGSWHYRQRRF